MSTFSNIQHGVPIVFVVPVPGDSYARKGTVTKGREPRSHVWFYFVPLDTMKADCKQCGRTVSTNSGKGRGNSTSAMRYHLKHMHKESYQELLLSEGKVSKGKNETTTTTTDTAPICNT